jgi:hypothetical protein
VPPVTFCTTILGELAYESDNDPRVRGAYALCQMYAATDEVRFELIVTGLARSRNGSALAEGARWLLARWHAAQAPARLNGPRSIRLPLVDPTAP